MRQAEQVPTDPLPKHWSPVQQPESAAEGSQVPPPALHRSQEQLVEPAAQEEPSCSMQLKPASQQRAEVSEQEAN
jgi:hypothetical protein